MTIRGGVAVQSGEVSTKNEISDIEFAVVLQPAIQKLGRAFLYAKNVPCDPWQFAVEMRKLLIEGLTTSDLRWLVMKGFVEHGRELTRACDPQRKFLPVRNLSFSKKTCFILTEAGLALMQSDSGRIASGKSSEITPAFHSFSNERASVDHVPHFDRESRTLCVFGQIVKQYRVPSPNQEAILAAFEEENWPSSITDPLSPLPETPPKLRLRETIRCLNANQKNNLLRFHGDGTGEGVRWKLSDNAQLLLPYLKQNTLRAA